MPDALTVDHQDMEEEINVAMHNEEEKVLQKRSSSSKLTVQ
jgi:hypothetical protein